MELWQDWNSNESLLDSELKLYLCIGKKEMKLLMALSHLPR